MCSAQAASVLKMTDSALSLGELLGECVLVDSGSQDSELRG